MGAGAKTVNDGSFHLIYLFVAPESCVFYIYTYLHGGIVTVTTTTKIPECTLREREREETGEMEKSPCLSYSKSMITRGTMAIFRKGGGIYKHTHTEIQEYCHSIQ